MTASGEPAPVNPARAAHDTIVKLIDTFCRTHLNDEYRTLCLELAGALARKRPSPLGRGKPEVWACGIIRVIGWVNFLDDSSKKPHLKLTAIDKAFGVAESTGQGKAKAIRDLFKIRSFNPDWTLPSRRNRLPKPWAFRIGAGLITIQSLEGIEEKGEGE